MFELDEVAKRYLQYANEVAEQMLFVRSLHQKDEYQEYDRANIQLQAIKAIVAEMERLIGEFTETFLAKFPPI